MTREQAGHNGLVGNSVRFVIKGSGTRLVTWVGLVVWQRQLRVLGYHDITSPAAFRRQMEEVVRRCVPVSGADVVGTLAEGRRLPDRAVWVTFDDGSPSVVQHAQPVLDQLGIKATMFVCPGYVASGKPYWWSLVETAQAHGVEVPGGSGAMDVATLKTWPDPKRRAHVDGLGAALRARGIETPGRQLTPGELDGWVAAGHEVGNHTWDHPCLDTCAEGDQRVQVRRADEWIEQRFNPPHRFFAYPNGNYSSVVEDELHRLEYSVGLLYDNRLARSDNGTALRLSRLRVDAAANPSRFRAALSGVPSTVFQVAGRANRLRPSKNDA